MLHMEHNNISIAKQVKSYIDRKPYIGEAVEQNIINYSALSREICRDLKLKNQDTVKVALIRISEKNRRNKKKNQKKTIEILRRASFSIKNKIAALHHSTFVDLKAVAYSKTPSGYMFFIDENIAKKTNFKKIDYDLAILHIKSDKEIEKTPGAIAFILGSLASEGINVRHVMGCREDTFIVLKEHDAALAFNSLSNCLRI